jgi:hypothetical protein
MDTRDVDTLRADLSRARNTVVCLLDLEKSTPLQTRYLTRLLVGLEGDLATLARLDEVLAGRVPVDPVEDSPRPRPRFKNGARVSERGR